MIRGEARYRYIDSLLEQFDDSLNTVETTAGVGWKFLTLARERGCMAATPFDLRGDCTWGRRSGAWPSKNANQ